MIFLSGTGTPPPVQKVWPRAAETDTLAQSKPVEGSFDRFAGSGELSDARSFHMELVSRISQEVRTATTTGNIQELRRQVQQGTYEVNADEIAAKMLLRQGADRWK